MWIFNLFLYLCFLGNPDFYQILKNQGATCWGYISINGETNDEVPVCFYEPSLTTQIRVGRGK